MKKYSDKQLSKKMCYVLRHHPEITGETLRTGGWMPVEALMKHFKIDRKKLNHIVRTDKKQRYSFNAEGDIIRCNQGHSVDVDLGLEPRIPPEELYHGTALCFLASIMERGIESRSRNHVHLSENQDTAQTVGARHGTPVVLRIDTKAMSEEGYVFYRSENGVWLTRHVLSEYIDVLK